MRGILRHFEKFKKMSLLVTSLSNWYEIPLVYFGLRSESRVRLRNSGVSIPIYKDKRSWNKVFTLIRLGRFVELAEDGKFYRVFLKELGEQSPPLSLDELEPLVTPLTRLLELVRKGSSYSNGIINLDFFPGRPSFKIDTWSEMPVVLHRAYHQRMFDELLPGGVEGKTVVDIGAFIGDTAIYFALSGAKQVVAFEPYPPMYRMLLDNIKLNNLSSRIEARNVAVGASFGEVELKMPRQYWRFLNISMFEGQVVAKAPIIPLEEALADLDEVDLVKLHCEGCEYPAIASADAKVLRKANTFLIKIHSHGTTANLIRKLREAGFKVTQVSSDLGLWCSANKE